MRIKIQFATLILIVTPLVLHADVLEGVVAFKDPSGHYSAQSLQNLAILSGEAARQGSVGIWVTFDMDFVGDPELRTPEVIAAEDAVRQEMIDEVVMPLVAQGHVVLHEPPEGGENAPGCHLSVTVHGLQQLKKHSAVKHIGYFPSSG